MLKDQLVIPAASKHRGGRLSMLYYATNYATKLDSPMWKRVMLAKAALESMAEFGDQQELDNQTEDPKTTQLNNKTRQFMLRFANQIQTSREHSAVEVCGNLLGHKNSYSSRKEWAYINLNTLYWAVFRRWTGLRNIAGLDTHCRLHLKL
ncbi:hypothetical protein CSOJ01_16127 [Colletotrichum sojae]|uniref:Uncharacterized protein n=1 Tax=Colletotrichum sojae TaxID=2175907 RepID=A0A8H6MFD5_9PEZI|nr:hypothetical protein CSOJ01_16127 [Colletotrichum sojae]